MTKRHLSRIAGISYLVIFLAAIFANFFVLESLSQHPVETVLQQNALVRFGIMAFLITVVFDVVVAWALQILFASHPLTMLSTLFRMMHAAIMGVAIFTLPAALSLTTAEAILHQVDLFNIIWLIGLFFFGIHLILLSFIVPVPKWMSLFLTLAGSMYMLDTAAHFLIPTYETYSNIFLAMVAIPSIIGEMSFSVWLLMKGGKSDKGSV